MPDASYIYVIGTRVAAPVKIGYTLDPRARLEAIRNGGGGAKIPHGVDLSAMEILYHCEGNRQLEGALHFRFRSLRVVGEWFNLDPSVAAREVRMAIAEMPWFPTPPPQQPELQPNAVVQVSAIELPRKEPRTDEMTLAARRHHRMFRAWVAAGFTEQQALSLLGRVVRGYGE